MPTPLTTFELAAAIDMLTECIADEQCPAGEQCTADEHNITAAVRELTDTLRRIVGRRWTIYDHTRQTIAIAAFSAEIIPVPADPEP